MTVNRMTQLFANTKDAYNLEIDDIDIYVQEMADMNFASFSGYL